MPLTQLSTLVLPAPFGPINANSSPAPTASETPSSTVRPPKRSVRRSISSSAIPSPAAAALGRAVEHDPAVLHDVAVVGDFECDRRALLDDQDGDTELTPDSGEPT